MLYVLDKKWEMLCGHLIALALVLLLFVAPGCGGGSSSSSSGVPAAAIDMDSKLTSSMDRFMPRVARFEGFLVFIFNPGTPLAQGVTLTPDPNPNAPPFSFTFTGDYDGNEDGIDETKLSGRATFDSDPALEWSGVTGQAEVDVAIPIVGHIYHASIDFSITSAERQLSGSGTFTNPISGETTTMTVEAATPLLVKPATGAPDAVSNSCGYSLEGQMRLERAGSSGTLKSTWNFFSNSASVTGTNRTFADSSGQTTALPDSTVERPCGSGGTINDWAGTYDQQWVCLPRESGRATITISVKDANTVKITDKDPFDSNDLEDVNTYEATTIGSPHSLRGFFIAGPPDSQYREDFNWTLRTSLSGFAQVSSYVYINGPNTGKGGLCVASAPRS